MSSAIGSTGSIIIRSRRCPIARSSRRLSRCCLAPAGAPISDRRGMYRQCQARLAVRAQLLFGHAVARLREAAEGSPGAAWPRRARRSQIGEVCIGNVKRDWQYGLNYYSVTPLPDCEKQPKALQVLPGPGGRAYLEPAP